MRNISRVLHLRWNNVRHRHGLGSKWLESSSAQKVLEVLADSSSA